MRLCVQLFRAKIFAFREEKTLVESGLKRANADFSGNNGVFFFWGGGGTPTLQTTFRLHPSPDNINITHEHRAHQHFCYFLVV